jgi:diguanylate cyclase (GGDEF)-like protein
VMEWLRRWWAQPSYYDWLSGYLRGHGVSGAVRVMMASLLASLALCLVVLLVGSDGPRGLVPVTMTSIALGGGVAGALLWTLRWPTHGQSVAFLLTSNASVALACAAHPVPLAALNGCIAFAIFGGYIAFFHTLKYVLYNFAVAASVGAFEAVRLTSLGHPGLAGVDLWLVLQINIALPVAIFILIRALSNDVVHAECDPLTGLLNRRGFQHGALGLLLARPAGTTWLLAAVIDLDCFKSLNDKYGHAAGDQALSQVAEALRTTCNTAVIARSGGEEFVIADIAFTNDTGPSLSQRMCQAIARLSSPVTASVGSACVPLEGVREHDYQSLLDEVVHAADTAMYTAKRNGGNQAHHSHLPASPRLQDGQAHRSA